MLILVLEASTASAKAMLYRSGEGVAGILSRNYSAEAGDTVTLDADRIVGETLAVGRELLAEKGIDRVDVVATCSIWSHSLVLLDRDRRPVSKLSTWADTTPAVTTEKYRRDRPLYHELYQRTGCPIHSTYTLWKYVHAKEHGDVSKAAFIASMPDYLFLSLTGEFAAAPSTACGGAFLNTHSLDWDELALKVAGIEAGMLPRLVESEFTAPLAAAAAHALGIKAGTPVVITGADGAMNQVAAGGFGDNVMTLSVGTSAALRLTTNRPVLAEKPSTWCYVGPEHKWIVGCATAGAGNCVDWFGKRILGSQGGITLDQLGEGARGALAKGDAPIFLPFPAGERCPGWNDAKTAQMCGLKLSHDIYDLYYAVLEGVLFNLKQCYDITVPIVGRPPKYISVSGGIEKSPFWLSMAASIFGLPVYPDGRLHASSLGAACMGLKVGGEMKSVAAIKPLLDKRFDPDPALHGHYARRYRSYLRYYDLHSAAE